MDKNIVTIHENSLKKIAVVLVSLSAPFLVSVVSIALLSVWYSTALVTFLGFDNNNDDDDDDDDEFFPLDARDCCCCCETNVWRPDQSTSSRSYRPLAKR